MDIIGESIKALGGKKCRRRNSGKEIRKNTFHFYFQVLFIFRQMKLS
jgi:hypothetical protein